MADSKKISFKFSVVIDGGASQHHISPFEAGNDHSSFHVHVHISNPPSMNSLRVESIMVMSSNKMLKD
jgi:hypothetical protein